MVLGLGTPRVKPHTDPVLSKSVKVTYRVVGVTGSAAIKSLSRKWVLPLAIATTTGLPKVEPPSIDLAIEISVNGFPTESAISLRGHPDTVTELVQWFADSAR